jgi:hypothetical protein
MWDFSGLSRGLTGLQWALKAWNSTQALWCFFVWSLEAWDLDINRVKGGKEDAPYWQQSYALIGSEGNCRVV